MFEQHNPTVLDTFTIASFPNYQNPYTRLFYNALRPYNIDHVGLLRFSLNWLANVQDQLDALHIHWPEDIWRREEKLESIQCLMFLWSYLHVAQKLGLKRIWTMHDLEPHHNPNRLDRVGNWILARHSDLLICHSNWAAGQLHQKYSISDKLVVMPHGNYEPCYPEPRPREVVLQEFGLSSKPAIVSCVGILRPYKGIEIACQASKRLQGEVQLVIAGRVHPTMDAARLQKMVDSYPAITLIPGRLTEQEFSDIVSISETVLLPYKKITGSGVLLAAWTLGCGVIASDLPYFREMIPATSNAGRLFKTEDADALAKAIVEYLEVSSQKRKHAALKMADQYAWDRCVSPVARIVTEWMEQNGSPTS